MTTDKNNEPLTRGFVQAGLDVRTSAVCIAVPHGRPRFISLLDRFGGPIQFRAGQTTMPHLHKALFVTE